MLAIAEKAKLGQRFGLVDEKEGSSCKYGYGNVE